MALSFNKEELTMLRALAVRFPTIDSALAELSALKAGLMLPKGTVHVVSDVHGEHKKLKHIINNASGSLRPLVERVTEGRLSPEELRELLSILSYPREAYAAIRPADEGDRKRFVLRTLALEIDVIRALSSRYSLRHVERV